MEKLCKKCDTVKATTMFYNSKVSKDGYSYLCKECKKMAKKLYYDKYPDKKRERSRRKYLAVKNNPERLKRMVLNKKKTPSYIKYRSSEKYKLKQKEYRKARYEKTKNDPVYRAKINSKERELRANNPLYRLKENTRRRIREGFEFSGHKKGNQSEKILGCTYAELKIWLQGKFKKGMSWENYGSVWHIDHKIPLSTAKTEADVILLCHYRNLQPLFAKENIDKKDKILPIQVALQI